MANTEVSPDIQMHIFGLASGVVRWESRTPEDVSRITKYIAAAKDLIAAIHEGRDISEENRKTLKSLWFGTSYGADINALLEEIDRRFAGEEVIP